MGTLQPENLLIYSNNKIIMNPNTIAVIGSTGLVGSHLLEILQIDNDFEKIKVLVRRPMPVSHPKVKVIVIDFEDETAFREGIAGSDAVFVAVGTTQKKVKGDQDAYRKVDYDIPVNAARFCIETGCRKFLLVSSVGANSNGGNFYLRLKGEVEEKVQTFGIPSVSIFRPSMLLGNRHESRPLETVAQVITKPLAFLFPSKYRPITASDVARGMVAAAKQDILGIHVYHYREMQGFNK
jgi:uncharacterized protein YbjT (DUF2867 family)